MSVMCWRLRFLWLRLALDLILWYCHITVEKVHAHCESTFSVITVIFSIINHLPLRFQFFKTFLLLQSFSFYSEKKKDKQRWRLTLQKISPILSLILRKERKITSRNLRDFVYKHTGRRIITAIIDIYSETWTRDLNITGIHKQVYTFSCTFNKASGAMHCEFSTFTFKKMIKHSKDKHAHMDKAKEKEELCKQRF